MVAANVGKLKDVMLVYGSNYNIHYQPIKIPLIYYSHNYLFRNKRLAIKSELQIRKKAMVDKEFPSQQIIDEFLVRPCTLPKLDLAWKQPNMIKFMVCI